VKTLLFAYASTSGHTEYVCALAAEFFTQKKRNFTTILQPIETISEQDLREADAIILASGTWNTEGIEGQLNPYMYRFVHNDFADFDFKKVPVLVIGCGDDRYRYTCRAAQYLEEYVDAHNAKRIEPTLRMINEPYHQHRAIEEWCDAIIPKIFS
jgi:flavodoxin I